MKTCSTCHRQKPIKEFRRDSRCRDGHIGQCNACVRAKHQERRQSNPEAYRAEWTRSNQRRSAQKALKWVAREKQVADRLGKLSVADLAYAAGFLDGEGTLAAQGRPAIEPTSLHLRVMAASTNRPVLEWLAERLGGSIHRATSPRSVRHHQVFYWYVGWWPEVTLIAAALLPYLKIKRRQAEILLELRQVMVRDRRGGVPPEWMELRMTKLAELAELNHRGTA